MFALPKIPALLAVSLLPLHAYASFSIARAGNSTTGYPPCDALIQAGLGDHVLVATDPEYEPRIQSWWSMNSRMHPWCIVQPRETAEVSKVLTTLLRANDRAGNWHIALRSGGHSLGLANNIDEGVTVDLGKLNHTSYNKSTNTASIGPGGKWMNVYAELEQYEVLATGGRDGDVGVGGFLLGGGMTFFVGRHGFGCDSIKNFEVVLANGTIVDANKDTNSDLYKALKGGGANYGIVTRFDMEALPNTPLAHGTRVMSGNHSIDLADFAVDFIANYQDHADDALVAYYTHDTKLSDEDVTALAIHVNNQNKHNSSAFEELRNIPSLAPDVTNSVSLAKAAAGSQVDAGTWNVQATLSFKNDKKITTYVVKKHEKLVKELSKDLGADNFVTMVFLQPLPRFFGDISNKNGGNVLGVDAQKHDAVLLTAGVALPTNQTSLSVAQARMNVFVEDVKAFAKSIHGANDLVFLNYAGFSQDPLGSYGQENVRFMKGVAAKYDPTGAFQERIPGGFKISRVE